MKKYNLFTVMGTRPEIIRLSRILKKCDELFNHTIIHTNQNYDYELNDIFFKDLNLRKPNFIFKQKNKNVYEILCNSIIKINNIIKKKTPDAFLILGDTNSALTSYVAKRHKIPIFHIEAGNRCFDQNVPEEINRKIIDHIADINIVYSNFARRNLLNEGISNDKIIKLGSPLYEVINYYTKNIDEEKILKKYSLDQKKFILCSFHREENIDNKINISEILKILNFLTETNFKILISTHPRLAKKGILKKFNKQKNIIFNKPFSFKEYLTLQKNSYVTISDSGSIPEESSILDFRSIIIRDSFERQEILENSSSTISRPNLESFIKAYKFSEKKKNKKKHKEYENINFSDDVTNIILSKIDYIKKYSYYI